jgi:hypothetical protein
MGRRFTNAISFSIATLACLLILLTAKNPDFEIATTCLVVVIKFAISITFYVVNLQAMETYPTCLRQTGLSMGAIVANLLGLFDNNILFVCVCVFVHIICLLFDILIDF